MGRFLIYFSYFGTRYSGVQAQKGQAVKTVGGVIKDAFKYLRPSNEVKLTLSSRTDKGVHALTNACHVDLLYPCDGKEYNPSVITNVLNYHLKNQQEDIRILQTRQISDSFSCRFGATGRKYVYRLGHVLGSGFKSDIGSETDGSEAMFEELKKFTHRTYRKRRLPLGESLNTFNASKAVIYRTELDISKLVAAAEMLSGIHNYLCFTNRSKENDDNLPHPVKMLTIGVKRGQSLGHRFQKYSSCVEDNIEFWDIHVQSRSFMYRQVRRLVGAMVLVAKNIITLDDLRDILDNPRKEFPFVGQMSASEEGLFLLDVAYKPSDLEFSSTVLTDSLSEQQELSHDADVVSASYASGHLNEGVITTDVASGHLNEGVITTDDASGHLNEGVITTDDAGKESNQVSEDQAVYCLPVPQADSVIVR